jgi:hypothetical protein
VKKFFKAIGYFLIATVFCISLSGCTKTTTSSKLVIWSFESADTWKPIIANLKKDNGGIDIQYAQQTLDSNYENRVLNSILSGSGPDIWSMPNDWVYRHKDKLAPMPDTIYKTSNFSDTYIDAMKQSVFFDQKVYALSPVAEPLMIYYNPKIMSQVSDEIYSMKLDRDAKTKITNELSEMPSLWSDWADMTKYITQKDASGNITRSAAAIGTGGALNSQDILYLLMLQNQTKIISDNLKLATFNLPSSTPPQTTDYPGVRALDFFTSFADPNNANYTWNDSLGNPLDAFTSGRVSMIFGYSNLQNYFAQNYPEFKYKKAFVPQLDQDATKIVDLAKFNVFGVSRASSNPTVAWQVVNGLSTTYESDFVTATNLHTSVKSKNVEIGILQRSSSNPEKVSLATAKAVIKGKYPTDFDSLMNKAVASVNQKLQTSKISLDTAAEQITNLLNKTTW